MDRTGLYLGLGSNLGDRRNNILCALEKVSEFLGVKAAAVSEIIETPSWGFDGMPFLNCVARYDIPSAGQDPELFLLGLLHQLQKIEKSLGRTTFTDRSSPGSPIYHDRTIDIDILLYGDFRICSAELTVPHPLIDARPFVSGPLSQVFEV